MEKIDLEQIKKLREKTKAGVMDCRKALAECSGDFKKAEDWLRKKGLKKAQDKSSRETLQGVVEAYQHGNGRIVSVVELQCETDFVARTEEFKKLAHELAMQVAAMCPKSVDDLIDQPYIRDEKILVKQLVEEAIGKIGENIKIGRIARFELGDSK